MRYQRIIPVAAPFAAAFAIVSAVIIVILTTIFDWLSHPTFGGSAHLQNNPLLDVAPVIIMGLVLGYGLKYYWRKYTAPETKK